VCLYDSAFHRLWDGKMSISFSSWVIIKWRWWMLGLQPTGGLRARVGWLGLKVGGQLALPCIRQMNRVNSRSDFHDDSSINIVRVLLLLLLLSAVFLHLLDAGCITHPWCEVRMKATLDAIFWSCPKDFGTSAMTHIPVFQRSLIQSYKILSSFSSCTTSTVQRVKISSIIMEVMYLPLALFVCKPD